jgi:acetoacetate decarboxylase
VSVAHPAAPWRLAGPCVVVPLLVPVARARRFVPGDVQIVPAAPGRTLGTLIGVTYETGSTLAYSELLVVCATVRSGNRVGGWISHIWVDDEQSVSGGRSIWKLPKDLAEFTLDRRADGTQRFAARADGATLVRLAAAPPRFRASLPAAAPVPMISGAERARFFTLGRSGLSAGLARVRVDVPPDSPLADLGFTAAPVGVSGRAQLVMDAARPI